MKILAIIAHPDDESVGLFTLLEQVKGIVLINPFEEIDGRRVNELHSMAKDFDIKVEYFKKLFNWDDLSEIIINRGYTHVAVPYPDTHVAHRFVSSIGEALVEQINRQKADIGLINYRHLIYYSIDMSQAFVRPLPKHIVKAKRKHLIKYYPSQKELWLSNGKYWLFEGHVMVI